MIPISRVELYLAKICGEDVELPIPQTRKEVFLAIIAGESYEKPVPSSRVELYLAKILGDDVPLPLPQSREEIFLAKIAGVEYPLPYPESRIEYWLHKWATYEEWETISGNPITFTAKAAPLRQLSVAFSPVQNLNGYDSPWPAGGGKNKLPNVGNMAETYGVSISYDSSTGEYILNGTFSETGGNLLLASLGQSEFAAIVGSVATISVTQTGGSLAIGEGTGYTFAVGLFNKEASGILRGSITATTLSNYYGTTNSFPDSTGNYSLYFQCWREGTVFNNLRFKIQLELSSSASAWTPYSNECPISGWSSLTVEQRGVNLWDEEWELGALNSTTGQNQSENTHIRSKNYIPVAPSTAYYNKGYTLAIFEYDANKVYLGYHNYATGTFTTNASTRYLRFYRTATTYNHDISINYPATDTAYHAYNPLSRSISISLGSTVYGGYVDVVTGVVTVEGISKSVTLAEATSVTVGEAVTYYRFIRIFENAVKRNNKQLGNIASYAYNTDATPHFYADTVSLYLWLANGLDSSTVFQAYTELATPLTFQLTPQEVESLLGDNTMWTDAQNLEVTYRSN